MNVFRNTRTKIAAGAALLGILLVTGVYLYQTEKGGAAAGAEYLNDSLGISDSSAGGDCVRVGTWNGADRSCTLTTDLELAPGSSVQITSDGITLDGNGHSVSGSGGNGILVSGRAGVSIENLSISGFSNGINLDSSRGSSVRDNRLTNNDMLGISLSSSSSITVEGNTVDSNMMGIGLSDSSGNTLNANSISNSDSGDGISLDHSDGNQLTGNTSNSNMGNGLCIDANNSDNRIESNTASNNTGAGIFLHQSDDNTVTGNQGADNSGGGISLEDAGRNAIYGNDLPLA